MFPSVTLAGWILVPIAGLALTGGGFGCLFYLIPPVRHTGNVRTELYLAKASYWAIIAGLLCTTVWLLMAVVVRSLVILKSFHVIH
jgi:hypothetical protein